MHDTATISRTARTAAIATLTALAAIAAIIAADLTAPVSAEPPLDAYDSESAGRIVARRLADGRVEFGWQPRNHRANSGWGETILPRQRYFPLDATVDRWLFSSPLELAPYVWTRSGQNAIGRINARLLSDGRIEFAFTPTDRQRIAPRARYFPPGARVGRWLHSTEIAIDLAPPGYNAISAGGVHTCAIRSNDHEIVCWGSNYDDRITNAPAGRFRAVSAGNRHTCALRVRDDGGAIECWGANTRDTPHGGVYRQTDQASPPTGSFRAVSAGFAHTCGVRTSGAIECWGDNNYGQSDAPAGSFSAVSAGFDHTCGLRTNGAITCWGRNGTGQSDAPAGSFIIVSAGALHTCGLRSSGAIECWGYNHNGQSDAPAGSYRSISAGGSGYYELDAPSHTCAIRSNDDAITCWGENRSGQTNAPSGNFTAVSSGTNHTCGLRADGAIECWGRNHSGQTDAPAR